MLQGRVGVCGHCLSHLCLQWATLYISPSGMLPNPKVASHENESLRVKKGYLLIILFIYVFPFMFCISIELVLLEKVGIKVKSFRFSATLPLLLPKGLQIKILLVTVQPLKDWKMRHKGHDTAICGFDYEYDSWLHTETLCIHFSHELYWVRYLQQFS